MFVNLKISSVLIIAACIATESTRCIASVLTTEIAKKCGALTAKAYPPRQIGNPAAGSEKGSGQAERDYFRKCVANEGKMDDQGQEGAK